MGNGYELRRVALEGQSTQNNLINSCLSWDGAARPIGNYAHQTCGNLCFMAISSASSAEVCRSSSWNSLGVAHLSQLLMGALFLDNNGGSTSRSSIMMEPCRRPAQTAVGGDVICAKLVSTTSTTTSTTTFTTTSTTTVTTASLTPAPTPVPTPSCGGDTGMCCPRTHTCMKPRGGSVERCVGSDDRITGAIACPTQLPLLGRRRRSRRRRSSRRRFWGFWR